MTLIFNLSKSTCGLIGIDNLLLPKTLHQAEFKISDF
jgi:hypothetical protein